jgi:hypothetical protein
MPDVPARNGAPHRVLLAGVPRGGTTWVGQVLARTADTRYVHEPDGVHDPFAFVSKLGLHHHPLLDPADDVPEYERLWEGAFAGGEPAGTPRDRLARFLFKNLKQEARYAARFEGQFSLRARAVRALAVPRVAGPPVGHVVVKSVNSALSLEWLASRFEPQVGVILRHPMNVVSSWTAFGWNAPSGPMYNAISARMAERFAIELPPVTASRLSRTTAIVCSLLYSLSEAKYRHPEWTLIVHEDVCVDPLTQFRSTADAIGLTWNADAERFISESDKPGTGYAVNRVTAEQPGRWRERLAAHDVEEAVAVCERFGEAPWWKPQV